MIGAALVALVVLAAAYAVWPQVARAPSIPMHVLVGEHPATDAALHLLRYGTWAAKVAAIPWVVMAAWGTGRVLLVVAAVAVILGVVWWLDRRRPRSGAAPLRDDAVFLSGCAVLAAWSEGFGALVLGALLGVGLIGGTVAALVALWGHGLAFAVTARPDFQVFAPNPDNRYALARIRVGQRDVVMTVPDNGNLFTNAGVYDPRMRRVALIEWDALRTPLEARGEVTVHVGMQERPDAADFSIAVAPGRYYLTVRNYLPKEPERLKLPSAVHLGGPS
ncbi:MAG: hypothetical protein JRI25_10275 [Deltaproteobacteria bacterium]|nr:hypothetical protein [Deltaproteobacteria bacterium]